MTEALNIELRETVGKSSTNALRKAGKVPAIVYKGVSGEGQAVALDAKELKIRYNKGGFTANMFTLKADKKEFQVVPRQIQFHPVTDEVEHVDFLEVANDTKIKVNVLVTFKNHEKSPGLKRGGILSVVRRKVRLLCEAGKIPSSIEVDLANVVIGQSIHISEVNIPNGATPTIRDRDFTIAAVVGRKAATTTEDEADEDAEGEEGDEAAAEGDAE